MIIKYFCREIDDYKYIEDVLCFWKGIDFPNFYRVVLNSGDVIDIPIKDFINCDGRKGVVGK